MSILGMNSALWAVYTSAENTERFRADARAFAAGFDLSEAEADALASGDLGGLLDLGAHPFLIFKLAFRLAGGFSPEFVRDYVVRMQGHELRDIVT